MTQDPFSVLGISSTATEDEIKSAYRKLAKKYHPDLNPGDKAAEEKMKEVNEAYAAAMQIRKGGGATGSHYQSYGSTAGGQSSNYGGYYGSGSQGNGGGSYGYGSGGWGQQGRQQWQGNPFSGFGFDPFEEFFGGGGARQQTGFRTRRYANPDLETVQSHVLAQRFHDALQMLNRIPTHDADWHALYARADLGLGNRISALEHARKAAQMAPNDQDYQLLLQSVESGRQQYQRTQQSGGYDFRNVICGNPFLSCCAINVALNCCLGGRFWMCC